MQVLPRYMPEGTKKTHNEFLAWYIISPPSFEQGTSRIGIYSFTISANTVSHVGL
jgi:hypothetical protein